MKVKVILMALAALGGSQTLSAQRPCTPLEYVAEYHMGTNKQTGAFATSHRNDSCGWYTPDEAKRLCPQGYHVPSESEMFILIPQQLNTYHTGLVNPYFGTKVYRNQPEEVQIAGVRLKYTAEYMGVKEYPLVKYGIRFIGNGNRYRSAYRYEQVGHFGSNSHGGYGDLKSYLLIQSKYLGNAPTTLEEVASEEFWQSPDIVTRVLPANGKLEDRGNWFNARIGSMFSIMAMSGTPIACNFLEFDNGDLFFWRFQGHQQNNFMYAKTCVVRPFLNQLPAEPQYNPSRDVHMTYTATVENRPALPIDYVADFNVGAPAKTFNITEEGADGSKYRAGQYKADLPAGYHVPTRNEMTGIFPEHIYGQNDDLNFTPTETITFEGHTSNYRAHYLYFRNRQYDFTGYALKFIGDGNRLLSAYKYEFDRQTFNLKVSCRYLGPDFKGEVHELIYPEFWMTDDIVTVQFPVTHDFYNNNSLQSIAGCYGVLEDGGVGGIFAVSSYRMGSTQARAFAEAQPVIRPFKNTLRPVATAAKTAAAKGKTTSAAAKGKTTAAARPKTATTTTARPKTATTARPAAKPAARPATKR